MKVEVPSRRLARAWRACQIVASEDEARPALHRTICVEVFDDHGMRMISTDSYVLVRAWVAFDIDEGNMEPEHEELPDRTFIVQDSDHRGLGMLKFIEKTFRKQVDEELIPKVLLTKQREIPSDQGVLEGLEGETLRIDWPFHEEVVMPIMDEKYPNWRTIENEREIDVTENISFTSATLGSLAKLCDLYNGYTLDWTLGGQLGAIGWKLGPLAGLLMPARPSTPDEPDAIAERT